MRVNSSGPPDTSLSSSPARPGRRAAWIATLAVAALAFAPPPASPQSPEAPPPPEGSASELRVSGELRRQELPAPNLRLEEAGIVLSLEEAIAIALERNLGLAVERYERAQSRYDLVQNRGIYDLLSLAILNAEDESEPAATQLAGAEISQSELQVWNFTLNQLTPYGGTLDLAWNNSRFETNSTFALLNPQFSSGLNLGFQQPLLRDFGRLPTERGILIARNNLGISRQDFELRVALTIQEVENAYWSLVEAREQLQVAEEGLGLARELHRNNEVRVEVGTLAPLELVQSEVGIATRQEEIIRARAAIGDAADSLRRLLNLQDPALWGREIVPSTEPEVIPVEVDLEQAITTAMEQRPELVQQQLGIENLEVDVTFFRNQTLPALDLDVNYGYNGQGGDLFEREFPSGDLISFRAGGYDDALDQVFARDFDGWTVALNFAYPIQNRSRRAQRTIAELAVARGRTQMEDLEQSIITEVRTAARGVETAVQQIESARATRRLAERNLDAERKRYENGMSTSFQILEIQEDLVAARSREVSAVATYRRALVQYYRATGRLIEEKGVEVVGTQVVED